MDGSVNQVFILGPILHVRWDLDRFQNEGWITPIDRTFIFRRLCRADVYTIRGVDRARVKWCDMSGGDVRQYTTIEACTARFGPAVRFEEAVEFLLERKLKP